MATTRRVIPFAELGRQDVGRVGGKNASLGEMITHLGSAGVRVPPGFATAADAYRELLDGNGLRARIDDQLGRLHEGAALDEVGAAIRSMILAEPLPAGLRTEIAEVAFGAIGEGGVRLISGATVRAAGLGERDCARVEEAERTEL